MRHAVALVGMTLLCGVAAAEDPNAEAPALTELQRRSYALGVSTARSIRRQRVEVDADLAARGLADALSGKALLLGDEEIAAAVGSVQSDVAKQVRRPSAAESKAQEESFLAENAKKEGVVTLPSGLQYRILRAGDGPKPSGDDRVVCHYRARFLDGTEFDSSYRRGRPATFELARVIPGWREALKLMPVGSRWQLFIPSKLAYGERGVRPRKKQPLTIGPNATLVYEAELLRVLPGGGSEATTTTTDLAPAAGAAGGDS